MSGTMRETHRNLRWPQENNKIRGKVVLSLFKHYAMEMY